MAAKKKSSRTRAASKARKPAARKKVVKKIVAKKTSRKKAVKKTPRKKTSTRKAARKKTAKKISKKKSAKKVAAKNTGKKQAARKKTSIKKAAKKKAKPKIPAIARKKVVKKKGMKKASAGKIKVGGRNRKPAGTGDSLHGVAAYKPRKGETYMGPAQLRHFQDILGAWKTELMQEVHRTVHHMQDEASNFPDPNDRATQESEFGLELRTRDRERKLLKKIASAMGRIDDGSYGFCEETGDEIGLQRLEARPVATLSVEAQERRELAERQYSDRDE